MLFFDSRLSAYGSVDCASCHNPDRAFTDGRPTSVGFKRRVGQRNAPTLLNAIYNKKQFWVGRAEALANQAAFPITNPRDIGSSTLSAAISSLPAISDYTPDIQQV